MRILLALGGNAIAGPNESVKVDHQVAAAREAATQITSLIRAGHQLLLSHGNGPQVGNILAKNELASYVLPPVPLDWCVANTQGSIGLILMNALDEALGERQTRTSVVVSRTLVAEDDPAFTDPTKPIGRYVDAETAERLQGFGQRYVEVDGKGYRRVVPSPQPLEILEASAINSLLDAGYLVVAAGGGGIPVVRKAGGGYRGIEAVVDKDLSSVLLARQIGADALVIATNVESVWLNFGAPDAERLGVTPVATMRAHAAAGHFGAGSMGPKVEAACRFVEQTGGRAIITSLATIDQAVRGEAGTVVVP